MINLRTLAAGLVLLAAAPAAAQQLSGGGDNAHVEYPAGTVGNVLGGGAVRVTNGVSGGLSTTYLEPMPQGRLVGAATLSGGGENAQVSYGATPAADRFAQRRN